MTMASIVANKLSFYSDFQTFVGFFQKHDYFFNGGIMKL